MKRLAVAFTLLLATGLSGVSASAAPKTIGICGEFDLRSTSNEMLERLIFNADLQSSRFKTPRFQCGLPGEELKICSACADSVTEPLMTHLRPIIGEPSHLKWHAAWHKLRAATSLAPATFQLAKDRGHIAQGTSLETFKAQHVGFASQSGEDFLYMHRLMIKMVQMELAAKGLPCIDGWKKLPTSLDDPKWPVPKTFATAEARASAERTLVDVTQQLMKLRQPELLKKLTLNKLGQIIEPSFHQALHNLYRGNPLCSAEAKSQGYCDDLLPVETSPLNKHFWKIHGLIDDLIGSWLSAHGYTEISTTCTHSKTCYQWQGTWVGAYPK